MHQIATPMSPIKESERHRVNTGRLKDNEIFALSESEKVGHKSGNYWFEHCCGTQSKRGGNPAISSREREKTSFFEKSGISSWDRTETIPRSEYTAVAPSSHAI
jgi:hypothetical protein